MDQDPSELIKGIFLVPALHLAVVYLWALILAILHSKGSTLDFFGFLSVTQFIYLIPVMLFYHRKREFETVKGISIGAMLTISITGACFSTTYGKPYTLMIAATIIIVLASMIFYSFRR
jgi:mannitol-specific phosphotransferase system IIBC component